MAADESFEDLRYQHHLEHRGQLNRYVAQLPWLLIAIAILMWAGQRVIVRCKARRKIHQPPQCSRPSRFHHLGRITLLLKSVTILPLPWPLSHLASSAGRLLLLTLYAGIIAVLLLTVDAPKLTTHFADDVAFRAAWVTVTQIPLVFLLSTKNGPLEFLVGLSYERINFLHKWIGRIMFICATIHMSIMMSSISITELMQSPDKAMAVVRNGVGAYGILVWIAASSLLPLRRWSYRMFYSNHWISAWLFLWVVGRHVPKYARLPIHASISIIVIDECLRTYKFLWNNITVRPSKQKFSRLRKGKSNHQVLAMGHPVKMMTPYILNGSITTAGAESTTVIRICNVPFSWKPGQHIRVYIPRLGPLETHPFTPATCSDISSSPFPSSKGSDSEHNGLLSHTPASANDMVLMIKSHSGLTKRLANYHSNWLSLPCPNASRPSFSLTAYLSGPYGEPPAWESYENIVLVATSTGVSFTLSILDYLEQLCFEGQSRLRTRRIRFVWVNRHIEPQFEATVTDLLIKHTTVLRESEVEVEADFYVTCSEAEIESEMREHDPFAHLRGLRRRYFAGRPPLRIRNPNALDDDSEEEDEEDEHNLKNIEPRVSEVGSRSSYETYVSSTLIDDEEDEDELSDLNSTIDEFETSCWDRMPSIRIPRLSRRGHEDKACHCPVLRRQDSKVEYKQPLSFITKCHGARPHVSEIVSESLACDAPSKSMVAVCSSRDVVEQIRRTVAKRNREAACSERGHGIDIHAEGHI